MATPSADRRGHGGLLHELRISAYMVVGMIAIVALALLLG